MTLQIEAMPENTEAGEAKRTGAQQSNVPNVEQKDLTFNNIPLMRNHLGHSAVALDWAGDERYMLKDGSLDMGSTVDARIPHARVYIDGSLVITRFEPDGSETDTGAIYNSRLQDMNALLVEPATKITAARLRHLGLIAVLPVES